MGEAIPVKNLGITTETELLCVLSAMLSPNDNMAPQCIKISHRRDEAQKGPWSWAQHLKTYLGTAATSEGHSMGTVIWDKSSNKKLPNDQRAADLLI